MSRYFYVPLLILLLVCTACKESSPSKTDLASGIKACEAHDYVTALRILKPLAEKGDPKAQYYLSLTHLGGAPRYPEFSWKKGEKWLKKAEEQKYPRALFDVAVDCFHSGRVDKSKYQKAREYFLELAEMGDPVALDYLGEMYLEGKGVPIDPARAADYFRRADARGVQRAKVNLHQMFDYGLVFPSDYARALKHYRKMAERNVAGLGSYNLGRMYLKGWGVVQNYETAVKWFERALERNFYQAAFSLGSMYYQGMGVKADPEKGLRYLQRAMLGDNGAGYLYFYAIYLSRQAEILHFDQAFKLIKDRAIKQQDPHAEYALGMIFYQGRLVPRDYSKAVFWLTKAAEKGHAAAQYWLSRCYHYGNGVLEEDKKQKYWIVKSAFQGNLTAMEMIFGDVGCALTLDFPKDMEDAKLFLNEAFLGDPGLQYQAGRMFEMGLLFEQDYAKAAHWYGLAAKKGHALALYRKARLHHYGQGVKTDYKKAFSGYIQAALQGVEDAYIGLGELYRLGLGCEKDAEIALTWYQGTSGERAWVNQMVGEIYAKGQGVSKNYLKAVHWFKKAEFCGYLWAEYRSAEMEDDDSNHSQKTLLERTKYLHKLAEKGDPGAQNNLGVIYAKGVGVKKDPASALKWLKRSARQGNPVGLYNLGVMFYNGDGVPHDYLRGFYSFLASAEKGYAQAQYMTGYCHYSSHGVPLATHRARKWFKKAVKKEHPGALYFTAMFLTGPFERDKYRYLMKRVCKKKYAKALYAWGEYILPSDYKREPETDKKALALIREAALEGVASAQYSLGVNSLIRAETWEQRKKAMAWIKQAAESEDYDAQEYFAEKLTKGEDVEKDLVQAYKWLRLARTKLAVEKTRGLLNEPLYFNANNERAYREIDDLVVEISKKMTPEQLKQAEFLTRTWQPPDRKYYLTN
ncbi:tetratricopeptide repeat protein [Dethiosulfatarculus sandiegensis]|nr:tetratricopeptide repeat protein [Dethiosulfatarculus sandiegensis]